MKAVLSEEAFIFQIVTVGVELENERPAARVEAGARADFVSAKLVLPLGGFVDAWGFQILIDVHVVEAPKACQRENEKVKEWQIVEIVWEN